MIKQLQNSLNKNHLIPFIVLCVLSIIVWYSGPLIAIADSMPLAEPEKRCYAIALLFLTWFFKISFLDKKLPKETTPLTSPSPELSQKLKMLEARIQGALSFLKKTVINIHGKNRSLNRLPWYLLIGPSGAGKTSLLAHSELHFVLAKRSKNNLLKTVTTENCDWWVTRELVLVDVPGSLVHTTTSTASSSRDSMSQLLWQGFLNLLKQYRGKQALNGVIITLALPELMVQTHQAREKIIRDLKKRISDLKNTFGHHLAFHLMITKCDLIPGFLEFFGDSSSDELSQTWGITLPPLRENEKMIDVVANRFNALIKRLNKQLIWRLHQERNPSHRPAIKDFPLQAERLKENCLSLLKVLMTTEPNLSLQGIYLTSSVQQQADEATTHMHSAHAGTQALQIMRHPNMPSRTYFTKQFLTHGLLHAFPHHSHQKNYHWEQHPKTYALALAVLIIAAFVLGNDFRHSIQDTLAIRSSLASYPEQQGDSLEKPRLLLNALQQAATDAPRFLPYSDRAQQQARATYEKALQIIVLPTIVNKLEHYLKNADNEDPANLYAALKAYLMLSNPTDAQADFFVYALKQTCPDLFDTQNAEQTISHIKAALTSLKDPMPHNAAIVAHARKLLIDLSPAELSDAILKDMTATLSDSAIDTNPLLGTPPAFTSKVSGPIPGIFTASAFQTVYDQQIVAAATEATRNNWVLGNIPNQANIANTAEQLRSLYIADYVNHWEALLTKTQILSSQNLTETVALIGNLSSTNHSPLLQLLNVVKKNTALVPITTASPKLAALNRFLASGDNQENNDLYKTLVALQQVHDDLQAALKANNTSSPALTESINQLLLLAKQSPEPLKTWLTSVAAESQLDSSHKNEVTSETPALKTVTIPSHLEIAAHASNALDYAKYLLQPKETR